MIELRGLIEIRCLDEEQCTLRIFLSLKIIFPGGLYNQAAC